MRVDVKQEYKFRKEIHKISASFQVVWIGGVRGCQGCHSPSEIHIPKLQTHEGLPFWSCPLRTVAGGRGDGGAQGVPIEARAAGQTRYHVPVEDEVLAGRCEPLRCQDPLGPKRIARSILGEKTWNGRDPIHKHRTQLEHGRQSSIWQAAGPLIQKAWRLGLSLQQKKKSIYSRASNKLVINGGTRDDQEPIAAQKPSNMSQRLYTIDSTGPHHVAVVPRHFCQSCASGFPMPSAK